MTIRSKLISLYGLLLVTLVAAALAYMHTRSQWQTAAEALSDIYAQDLRVEELRAAIHNQVNFGLDLLGDTDAPVSLEGQSVPVAELLAELEMHAAPGIEREHIEGLAETQTELEWRLAGIVRSHQANVADRDLGNARSRLREIAEEVNDDVVALNQYYQAQVDARMRAAQAAGGDARVVIVLTALAVLAQIMLLVVLIQRLLIRPMASVGRTAGQISQGDLAARIEISSHDEWQALGQSINQMAMSLEIARQKDRTQERFSTLGEVAAYAAHNIKNPLASIRMTAQSSLEQFRSKGRDVAEPLEDIIQAADTLDGWVRRFLDFARPLELRVEPVDFNELVKRAASLLRSRDRNKDIAFHPSFADAPEPVTLDPILIEQAVVLLLGNAFESGGDAIRVETSFYRDGGDRYWASVAIDDNGEGLPAGAADDMFKVFVSRKRDGTGLGLSQTRKIVDLHGGSVGFQSKAERGACVVMRIPSADR